MRGCTAVSRAYPRQYVANKLGTGPGERLRVDGALDEPAWLATAWSADFVDISEASQTPQHRTRVKMLWDDEFLYVGAELAEPQLWANISATCHCVDARHDQVIFHDNDFEIFVDPAGSTHGYKEFEVNALNATWDLLLNKPYSNGGSENSTRLNGRAGFDLLAFGLRSAVRVHGGVVNDADATGPSGRWVVEVALPLAGLAAAQDPRAAHPAEGHFWRINFSRVEHKVDVRDGRYFKRDDPEDNWVWQPMGVVDMHRPDRWGVLQFAAGQADVSTPMPDWPARFLAAEIYEAEHRQRLKHGAFSENVADLDLHRDVAQCMHDVHVHVSVNDAGASFLANVTAAGFRASISNDRKLTVEATSSGTLSGTVALV